MSASLAEKIRRARECSVEIQGITFRYNRPTDVQMAALHDEFNGRYSKPEIARRFVIGWGGISEADLIPGGSADTPAVFDSEAFGEWLDDARNFWTPLYEAILGAYADYSAARDDEVKN
jgi:hypothetical protein